MLILFEYDKTKELLQECNKLKDFRLRIELYHNHYNLLNTFMEYELARDNKGNHINNADFNIFPKSKEERILFNKYIYENLIDSIIIRAERIDFAGYHKLNIKFKENPEWKNCDIFSLNTLWANIEQYYRYSPQELKVLIQKEITNIRSFIDNHINKKFKYIQSAYEVFFHKQFFDFDLNLIQPEFEHFVGIKIGHTLADYHNKLIRVIEQIDEGQFTPIEQSENVLPNDKFNVIYSYWKNRSN